MRYRLFAMLLLPFALGGCLDAQTTTAQSTLDGVPALTLVHSDGRLPGGVGFLEFSKNGETISVADSANYVGLYSVHDYAPLDEPLGKISDLKSVTIDSIIIPVLGVGHIDANTWYYATRERKDVVAHIRSIHPMREMYRHSLGSGVNDRPVIANDNFIAFNKTLVNWRSGKIYSVKIDFPRNSIFKFPPCFWGCVEPDSRGFTLTHSGRVLMYSWYFDSDADILLDDPAKGTIDYWDAESTVESIVITPDERHVVTVSRKGACKLWRLPEKEEIGQCGRGHLFRPENYPTLALAPEGKQFAVATEKRVRVYRVEPFEQILEVFMPDDVSALALSDDGKLAASDWNGHLRVWNITARRMTGWFDCEASKNRGFILRFQPGGNKLAVTDKLNWMVFELP